MKLTTALTKLKNLKSELSRTEGYVANSVTHYEDSEPEHIYVVEIATRTKLVNEILELKSKIAVTNCTTKTNFEGKQVVLNDLILLNAQLRSELAYWTVMQGHKTEPEYGHRDKDSIKKVFAKGYSKLEIKARLNQLEKSKEQVEAAIAQANMETDLVG